MNKKNDNYREMLRKKNIAHHLLIVKGYTQKEAAKLVGVSEHTMCTWVKKFGWKDRAEKNLLSTGGVRALMEGFVQFVEKKNQSLSQDIKSLWKEYLLSLEIE